MSTYLTDEDFAIAEANEISRENAYNRFYNLGWSRERSITEKTAKYKSNAQKYHTIRKANGISRHTYYRAINEDGKSPEWACVHAKPKPRGPARLLTPEQKARAIANGLRLDTVYSRLRKENPMSVEDAITIPVGKTYLERRKKA